MQVGKGRAIYERIGLVSSVSESESSAFCRNRRIGGRVRENGARSTEHEAQVGLSRYLFTAAMCKFKVVSACTLRVAAHELSYLAT